MKKLNKVLTQSHVPLNPYIIHLNIRHTWKSILMYKLPRDISFTNKLLRLESSIFPMCGPWKMRLDAKRCAYILSMSNRIIVLHSGSALHDANDDRITLADPDITTVAYKLDRTHLR